MLRFANLFKKDDSTIFIPYFCEKLLEILRKRINFTDKVIIL